MTQSLVGNKVVSKKKKNDDFYVRYYVGHYGKFGHEFMEFEFLNSGLLRYANNSKYKGHDLLRKQGIYILIPHYIKQSSSHIYNTIYSICITIGD